MNFKRYKIVLLSFILQSSVVFSNTSLIKQGNVSITFDDLDGYSYTIPKEKRSGFFYSPERIDSTLKTLLTIKHIVKYAESEKLINKELINNQVSEYLLTNEQMIKDASLSDIEFLKLKSFIYNQAVYKFMHLYIKNSVKDQDVIDLSKEKYLLEKNNYYNDKETRSLDYITIKFDDNNKDKGNLLANKIASELKNTDLKTIQDKYKTNKDIIIKSGINGFYYNEKYKKFSEYIFSSNKTGVIENILELENSLVIVDILKINEKGHIPFSEVKKEIIQGLKKEKVKLKFGNIVSQLTQDEIIIDEEAIISLKTRYLPK